jgi:hypothetical protein
VQASHGGVGSERCIIDYGVGSSLRGAGEGIQGCLHCGVVERGVGGRELTMIEGLLLTTRALL